MDIAQQLVKKNVRLVHHIDPKTPVIIADKKRLTQIIYNLMGNALKFTHHGSVVVNVKPAASGTEVALTAHLEHLCMHNLLMTMLLSLSECWC